MVNKHMDGTNILHLKKDNRLVAIMTPDLGGMDHAMYPQDTNSEMIQEIMRILSLIPPAVTLEERTSALKKFYEDAGFTVEEVI